MRLLHASDDFPHNDQTRMDVALGCLASVERGPERPEHDLHLVAIPWATVGQSLFLKDPGRVAVEAGQRGRAAGHVLCGWWNVVMKRILCRTLQAYNKAGCTVAKVLVSERAGL